MDSSNSNFHSYNNRGLRVPYGQSVHGYEEIEAVVKVLKSTTQLGESVKQMEKKVSSLFEKKHGVMVNSGSSANYLAIEVLNLPKGSEVITPVLTFATTVSPIIKNGLIPSFVDVEEETYNIDISKIEEMINSNTKALMIPNLLGNFSDWKEISRIAKKYNLICIEDSADCLGSTLNGLSTGHYSEISTTSFYGSHIINCAGSGGMVCVNSEEAYEKIKLLRSWGRRSSLIENSESIESRFNVLIDGIDYDAKFIFDEIGYNLEPTEIGAAFGLIQLEKLYFNIDQRVKCFLELYNFFQKYIEFFSLPKQLENSRTGWLAFPLCVLPNKYFNRKDIQIYLEERNIQTRTVLTGNILRQPAFKNIKRKEAVRGYPNADRVMESGFLIGCHHGLSEEQIDYIKEVVVEFINNKVKN